MLEIGTANRDFVLCDHLPPEHEVTGSNPVGTTNFLEEKRVPPLWRFV